MGPLLNGINESHNGYLETYLNLGWIGVGLLFLLIVTGYRNIIAAFRKDARAGILRLAFFIVAIVYGFTEAAAFGKMSPVWFGFLMAIIAVPGARLTRSQAPAVSLDVDSGVDNIPAWNSIH